MEPLPLEQEQTPPRSGVVTTFWTTCPSCKLRHLYPLQIMGIAIKCIRESCKADFFAYADIAQETKSEKCVVSPKKEDQNHSRQNVALASNANIFSSCREEVSPSFIEPGVNFVVGGNSRGGKGGSKCMESTKGRQRFQELEQEGSSSDVEGILPTEFENSTGRKKKAKQVVAADDGLEGVNGTDTRCCLKSKLEQDMKSIKEIKCSRELEQEGSSSDVEDILPTELAKSKECKKKGKQVVSADDEGLEGANGIDSRCCLNSKLDQDITEVAETDFYDFDRYKREDTVIGKEREDIPEVSFELDPASLSGNIERASSLGNEETKVEANVAIVIVSPKAPAEETLRKQKKRNKPEERTTMDRGGSSKCSNSKAPAEETLRKQKKRNKPEERNTMDRGGSSKCSNSKAPAEETLRKQKKRNKPEERNTMDGGGSSKCSNSKAPAEETLHKQKKRNKPEEKNTMDRGGSSKRSNGSRRLENVNKKTRIVKTSTCLLDKNKTTTNVNKKARIVKTSTCLLDKNKKTTAVPDKQKSCDDSTFVREAAFACHAAADSREMCPDGCMGTIPSSHAHLEPETVFYNFENDTVIGKEREDIPEVSFELDPASLSGNIERASSLGNEETKVEANVAIVIVSPKAPAEETLRKQKKRNKPEERTTMDRGGSSKCSNSKAPAEETLRKQKKRNKPEERNTMDRGGSSKCSNSKAPAEETLRKQKKRNKPEERNTMDGGGSSKCSNSKAPAEETLRKQKKRNKPEERNTMDRGGCSKCSNSKAPAEETLRKQKKRNKPEERNTMDGGGSSKCSNSKAPAEETLHKQKKRNKPEEKNTMDRGGSSKRSNGSRRLENVNKKTRIVKTSTCLLDKNKKTTNVNKKARIVKTSTCLLDKNKKTTAVPDKQKSCDDSTFVREAAFACHAAADSREMCPDGCMGTIPSSHAHLEPETVFYNFENDRSSEKFKTGQIWALYCDLDDLPRYYVKVKNVISSPVFKMDIQQLESCSTPKGVIPFVDSSMPVCCGTFKVTCDQVFDDLSYFSHQLSCVKVGIDLYDIYPRKGEVWALYKKFSSKRRCSNLKKYGYYIAEVINVEDACPIQVRVLQNVTGLKTVVQAINEEGECSFLTMPWRELYRFSHQIPSFKLAKEKRGYLYGRWALDTESVPDKLV